MSNDGKEQSNYLNPQLKNILAMLPLIVTGGRYHGNV